jgi:hypothetical protein
VSVASGAGPKIAIIVGTIAMPHNPNFPELVVRGCARGACDLNAAINVRNGPATIVSSFIPARDLVTEGTPVNRIELRSSLRLLKKETQRSGIDGELQTLSNAHVAT